MRRRWKKKRGEEKASLRRYFVRVTLNESPLRGGLTTWPHLNPYTKPQHRLSVIAATRHAVVRQLLRVVAPCQCVELPLWPTTPMLESESPPFSAPPNLLTKQRPLRWAVASSGSTELLHQTARRNSCFDCSHRVVVPDDCTGQPHRAAALSSCTKWMHGTAAADSRTEQLYRTTAPTCRIQQPCPVATLSSHTAQPCRRYRQQPHPSFAPDVSVARIAVEMEWIAVKWW
jgi:hypothetical protein